MKQEEILNYILHPDRLKEISFERLKQALTDYPYSQNLHFLLAQKSMQEQHPDFERHLKTAATYMNNRSFLRKQLQQSDRPSQPIVEPEPEVEPAQGNSTHTIITEDLIANLPDDDLPPVEFIPDPPIDENVPNHVADIMTDTPPGDQPPPNETSIPIENLQDLEIVPPVVSKISLSANQADEPEIPPVEKKITIKHEPIEDQPRIIQERIVVKVEPEEPIASGSNNNIPDVSKPQAKAEKVSDIELDLDEEIQEILTPSIQVEEPEIMEFPKQFDFDDEMDDLLSKPLIEVIPEKFATGDKKNEPEEEQEDEILEDLLLEDFDEILLPEDMDTPTEDELTVQPKLGKWIKKYQSSSKQEKGKRKKGAKKKNKEDVAKAKASKTKKKTKKKETTLEKKIKDKKTEKTSKKKESDAKNSKKKKKKDASKKISKKKAIRKFANRSIVEDGETISMTLADLYVKQGKIEKAIVAYQRLSLIIPEKKAFFASLIKKLKKK